MVCHLLSTKSFRQWLSTEQMTSHCLNQYTWKLTGPSLNIKPVFPGMGIPMLKIRRSQDRLIFNMWIPILVRRYLYIKMVPSSIPSQVKYCSNWPIGLLFTQNLSSICLKSDLFEEKYEFFTCLLIRWNWNTARQLKFTLKEYQNCKDNVTMLAQATLHDIKHPCRF